jgi:hypothetical protein
MEEKIGKVWFEKGAWDGRDRLIVHTPLRSEEFKYDTRQGNTILLTVDRDWNSRFGNDTLYDEDVREAFRYMPWEVLPTYDGDPKYVALLLSEKERIEFVSNRLNKIFPYYEKYGKNTKSPEGNWDNISCFPAHEFLENIKMAQSFFQTMKSGKRTLRWMTESMKRIEEAEEFLQEFLARGGKI